MRVMRHVVLQTVIFLFTDSDGDTNKGHSTQTQFQIDRQMQTNDFLFQRAIDVSLLLSVTTYCTGGKVCTAYMGTMVVNFGCTCLLILVNIINI